MNKKVKFDRGEMEERIVDIYASADTLRDEPDSSGKRPFLVAAVCLGMLCVLLAGIIGLSVYYHQIFYFSIYILALPLDVAWQRDILAAHLKSYSCPETCQKLESSWYFLTTENKTWKKSREDCLERGADLKMIFNLNKRVWIGLTDFVTEGTWRWVDGIPLTTPREYTTALITLITMYWEWRA
uniref:C-type lectin domain-containing protein n=1 Tax=Hucho hucho TaxID=62062 RepID=A0A4W5QP29_9TELE